MADDQLMNEWQDGFLVKDPGGTFSRVHHNESIDVDSGSLPTPPPPAVAPKPASVSPTPKIVATPVAAQPAAKSVVPTPSPTPFRPSPPLKDLGPAPAAFIDKSDEEEIKRHAAELQKMVTQPASDPAQTVDAVVERVIRKHNLTFDSDLMQKRFAKVLESFIRGLRSAIEVEDVLQRQTKIGGLGFAAPVATAVIESVMVESDTMRHGKPAAQTPVIKKPASQPAPERGMYAAAPPAFVPRPGGAAPVSPVTPTMPADMAAALAAMKPPAAAIPPAPIVSPVPRPPVRPAVPISETPRPVAPAHELYGQSDQAMPRIRQTMRPDKPQMIDIRQPAGVVGPVEEIHQVDLQEFRRLGTNPSESADKVYEKIELLEEESWEMRMQAVQAWRTSPLFALYLAIGRESMEQNVPIGEIVRKRRESQQPFLLTEEFFAINALNARLVT
ncbi:MAG: hypothetical protein HZC01_01335 [Candidatus Kerfeldbacteria bacterium]|nr:hypothetical protein [Candidatus Kerfeldbacteria bacterium]